MSSFPALKKSAPAVVLAPMEGVTDAPMRALLTELGGFSFCVSEFLRISQDIPPVRVFHTHVPELKAGAKTPSGTPVQVQLLGGDPEKLAKSALVALRAGADAIDLNFGCPAPTVNRNDGGATLLKYPDRIFKIVQAVREAVPRDIPVSAKLRLGWDSIESIDHNAEMAAKGGASWITIHGRTRLQGYQPPVYWGPIGRVRRNLDIPVVANGDLWTREDFLRCREETGCEHFMLGRSALADPDLARVAARELGLNTPEPQELRLDPVKWLALFKRFAEISRKETGYERYITQRLKQWVRLNHLKAPNPWFEELKRLESIAAIFDYMENLSNRDYTPFS